MEIENESNSFHACPKMNSGYQAGILYTWFLLIDKNITSQVIWTKEVLIRLLFCEFLGF